MQCMLDASPPSFFSDVCNLFMIMFLDCCSRYNAKSDVWALGCVLYELATLRHAFEGQVRYEFALCFHKRKEREWGSYEIDVCFLCCLFPWLAD